MRLSITFAGRIQELKNCMDAVRRTVKETEKMKELIDRGTNDLITDYPDLQTN